MRRRLVALAFVCACEMPQSTTPPPEPDPPVASTPLEPETPINRGEGERLEVSLPLVDGRAYELGAARARPTVIELVTGDSGDRSLIEEFLAGLRAELGVEAFDVVVVMVDPRSDALDASEGRLGNQVALCWDPQGAVAARLRVAGFPTLVVVDAEGRVATVERGFDDTIAQRVRDALVPATP